MQQWQKRRGEAPEMDGMEGSNDAEDFQNSDEDDP